jgi:hypothetical protein
MEDLKGRNLFVPGVGCPLFAGVMVKLGSQRARRKLLHVA